MSLGSDFISGFEATRSIKEKKMERALREKMLERDLANQKERQKTQLDAEAARLHAGFGFTATESEKDRAFRTNERTGTQTFTSGEREKDRGYGTSERVATQTFQGGENEKGRGLSRELQMQKMAQDAAAMKQGADQFGEKMGWEKDPMNPDNVNKMAYARYLDPDGAPPVPALPEAQKALENGRKGMGPPQAAIDMLRANPSTGEFFRAKYGVDPEKYLKR